MFRFPRRLACLVTTIGAALLVFAAPALAGTYTFSFQEATVDNRLLLQAPHGDFDAVRDYSTAVAGWHGPRVRTTAGSHTAGSFAMLDLVAPVGATFIRSSLVVRYRGCAKEANRGFWMEASVLAGNSEAAGTRRTLPNPDGCTEVSAETPGSSVLARPNRIRFKLGSTGTDPSHIAGTYVLVNQIRGTVEDLTAPGVSALAVSGIATQLARVVSWTAGDGQAGPRSVSVRVTGPGGYDVALAGWNGSASPNAACLAGQWISGCQTSVSGAVWANLPVVTGTYRATVTVTDGAGNVATAATDFPVVAAPQVLAAPTLSGTAQVGSTMTLAGGAFSNGPDSVLYAFHRLAGGTLTEVRAPSASPHYLVQRADHGAAIVGRVIAANAAGSAQTDSTASAAVLPSAPSGGQPSVAGLPVVDGSLSVAPGTWDNGGAPGQPALTAVRWFSCAAACALVGHDATYVATTADVGRGLRAEVDVANAGGAATATTALTVAVAPGAPGLAAPPLVSGMARVGETLSAAPGAWTEHGAAVATTIKWLRCTGADVATCTETIASGPSLLLGVSDRATRLRVRVDATNAGGAAVAWSEPTDLVLGRNECVLVAPGEITTCIGVSSRVTLQASLDRTTVTAGRRVTVRGRVVVSGDVPRPAAVTVEHGGRSASAPIAPDGSFSHVFAPPLRERVTVAIAIEGRGDALVLDVGEVRVVPRISARFTVRRDVGGSVRDLRVTGRVVPRVPLSRFRLLLEGRTPQGRVVGLICRVSEQPTVVSGRFAATCRSRGLPPKARFRVRFLPGPGSPLEAARTPWQRAALRR